MVLRNRAEARFLLGVMLLWQAGVFVHLVTAAHTIRYDGTIVRSEHPDAPKDALSQTGERDRDSNRPDHQENKREGCALLASLTTPSATASGFHHARIFVFETTLATEPRGQDSHRNRGEALFRLSPSQSPPA